MKTTDSKMTKAHGSAAMIVTRRRFEKISAVEGLVLSPGLSEAFDMFEAENWPPEKRRAFIRRHFSFADKKT